jgi:heme exporter protein CcmD
MSVAEFVGEFAILRGYGFYVWGSYAACALAIAAEIVVVRARLAAARRATGGREISP